MMYNILNPDIMAFDATACRGYKSMAVSRLGGICSTGLIHHDSSGPAHSLPQHHPPFYP